MKAWHVVLATIVFAGVGYFTSSSIIDFISAVSGLLCVWLAARENIWTYPVGLVNIALFMYIFYGANLYADFTLQIFFLGLSIYGWIYWLRNRGNSAVRPTTRVSASMWVLFAVILIAGTGLWGWLLESYTDASIPYVDAFIAILSVIAQILLSSKKLENWFVWMAVNVLSIGMYFYKDLYVIGVLYIVFLINAIFGYISWRKKYNNLPIVETKPIRPTR